MITKIVSRVAYPHPPGAGHLDGHRHAHSHPHLRGGAHHEHVSHRERTPSPLLIAASLVVYFAGAIGIGLFDRGFLLMAWLMSAFLAIAVYLTIDGKGPLFNAYTLFFGGVVAINLLGFFMF